MKKIIVTSSVLLATTALVLLGLFLPDIAFSYQNRQIQETVKLEEMEQISFSWSTGLIDTMRLISSGNYNLTDAGEGNYDTSEIVDIITDYVNTLFDYGLIANRPSEVYEESIDYGLYYAIENTDADDPDLTSSESEDLLSAKIYIGVVTLSNNLEFEFFIDDQTGKVAAFCYYPSYSSESYNTDLSSALGSDTIPPEYDRNTLLDEDSEFYAGQITSFFEDYYEYSVSRYESVSNDYSMEYQYYFEVSESEDTESLAIYIAIYDVLVYFNLY